MTSASTPLRVGVVGTGFLGRIHARILTEMPEAEMVGFVERTDSVAADVAATLGIRRFENPRRLAEECDAVVIAAITLAHAEIAAECIEAGCDVLLEKPITATPDEARQLIELARSKGRLIQVGHVERYNPAIRAVESYGPGTKYFEAQRIGVYTGRSLDIDVLLDLMIHDLHLVVSLTGSTVRDIQAVGIPVLTNNVDIANVRLQMENGAVANLTASRVSFDRIRKFRMFGTDSYLSIDLKEQSVKGYRLIRSEQPSVEPIDVNVMKKEPLRAELEAFVESVQTRQRPLVSGEDGLQALELAVAVGEEIQQSLRTMVRKTDE